MNFWIIKIEIKRLYSGNIGKKNIFFALLFLRLLRTKVVGERFEIYFHGTQKSKKKMILYDNI